MIDYLNNDPDDLIEKENAEKIKKIKSIVDNKPELTDAEAFLYGKEEAKRLFNNQWTDRQRLQLARLGTMRILSLKETVNCHILNKKV